LNGFNQEEDEVSYRLEDDLIEEKTTKMTIGLGIGEAIDLVDQSFN
jgi:hypothetical protein